MIFTTKGPNPGAIIVQWNIKALTKGSAGMWDCIIRAGGAEGSDLQAPQCPMTKAGEYNMLTKCKAAYMMMHMTKYSSGYFENLWAWTADHDMDSPNDPQTNINVYTGRGILIESQGPTWFYGGASEHSQLYQWQLSGAKNILLGHVQSETPYYQGPIISLLPFKEPFKVQGSSSEWASDPKFAECPRIAAGATDMCRRAWGLRIVGSQDIHVYSAGIYSFFTDSDVNACSQPGNVRYQSCQDRLVEVVGSTQVTIYNLFTIGSEEMIRAPK
jgi:glucan 1,3-beta-glucosidase